MTCHECGKNFKYGLCPACFIELFEQYRKEVERGNNQHRQQSGTAGSRDAAGGNDGRHSGDVHLQENKRRVR